MYFDYILCCLKTVWDKKFIEKSCYVYNGHIFFQGHFIEVQVTDGALYRTKIHCYFLDQTRVVHPLPNEKNYHIFYQMLAGLSQEERGESYYMRIIL